MNRLGIRALTIDECRFALPTPQTLLPQIVESNSPAKVGAPEIIPVVGSTTIPDGRLSAPNNMGAAEAAIELESEAFSTPVISCGPVMIGTPGAMDSSNTSLSDEQGLMAVITGK